MNQDSFIYAIVGPTASGKTELAVSLAKHLGNGEVINCDSVQIYREIEIATAKPSVEEMDGVPHHLLNYVDPRINYTAADWAKDAELKITELLERGATPILAGGTGFYLRTLREPLFDAPKTDPALRNRLAEIRKAKGSEHLHKILQRVDPPLADKLFPRDFPRVQRAVEVFLQTGRRLSELQQERKEPPSFAGSIRVFVLNPQRDILYERINTRAIGHFEKGLVEEVSRLRKAGIDDSTNALGSHGYRRVCEYLRAERTLASAIEKTQQDVRNYAKRQYSWFKKEKGAQFLNGFGDESSVFDQLLTLV